jgi:hypothetical protein
MDTQRLIRPGAGLTVSIARELLTEYGQVNAARNELIRVSWYAGVNKTEIARRMGLSRSTVLIVLTDEPEDLAGELRASLAPDPEERAAELRASLARPRS